MDMMDLKRCSKCVMPETHETIFYDEEGAVYVMFEDGSSSEKVYIETGARSDAYTEVLSGKIDEGTSLIVNQIDGIEFQVGSGQGLGAAGRIFR